MLSHAEEKCYAVKVTGGERALLINRLKWLDGGFEELQNIMGALEAMSDALEALAPPLPKYSSAGFESLTPVENLETPAVDPTSPFLSSQATNIANQATIAAPSIQEMYRTCLKSLHLIVKCLADTPASSKTITRLTLWGTGVLDGPFSIDRIIERDPDTYKMLREFILKVFVNIAVTQGEKRIEIAF